MRREGWLRVSSSRGVRRLFVVSDGFVVKCFATPPSAAPKRGSLLSRGSKARLAWFASAFAASNLSITAAGACLPEATCNGVWPSCEHAAAARAE